MFAVIKKEFKSYFYSPVGYVFIGLFLIIFSIFFYVDVFQYQRTNFEYIFYSGATILTFIVPILTMRAIAEERKTGKIKDPVSECGRLLKLVGLDETFLDRFPHELSGGQLQRVCIARAVACKPQLILFDEAISSLDAHTQVQVMDLLMELKDQLGLTYVFITHDLTSVTYLCDQVLFLYKGKITEHIPVEKIAETSDPYARKLLDSIIEFDEEYDNESDIGQEMTA